ncbi:glycosyltransferase [Microbacterium sp. STN6]|uniref:glycosyltransferase n=1 Tax=Microbacterium sp. STN6 TaxID=2995588 RepID=UPI002260828D|nr:glycosyltransferase [Microbacterium sp. STN6]MCX7521381.1 glycosyltransferase [Microbacterium sp. STN6]
MPLRIGIVSMHTSPSHAPGSGDAGGMNVVVLEQARQLALLGHDVHLITRRTDGASPDTTDLAAHLTLHAITAGPARFIGKGEHEQHIVAFRQGLERLGPFDLMHSHHWFSGMAALPVARHRGIPHVQSFHSIAAANETPLSAGERAESPGRLAGEAHLAAHSDAVTTVSDYEARIAVDRLGAGADRVFVVQPGVDSRLFRPQGAPHARPGHVAVAARIHPLKGLELAIDALALMADARRPSLVVAGEAADEYRDYADTLHERASRGGVTVRWAGPLTRQQLATLFATARAVLVPSHSETFGLVALEASACGVPVLATASGGLDEAVHDGVTGTVLDTRDPGQWAAALTRLLDDDALATRLGQAGRELAVRATWKRSAERLLSVYDSTMRRIPARECA